VLLPQVLALYAATHVAQYRPGKATTVTIRPYDDQLVAIPHDKAIGFLCRRVARQGVLLEMVDRSSPCKS
jgi:hypothetical protein